MMMTIMTMMLMTMMLMTMMLMVKMQTNMMVMLMQGSHFQIEGF